MLHSLTAEAQHALWSVAYLLFTKKYSYEDVVDKLELEHGLTSEDAAVVASDAERDYEETLRSEETDKQIDEIEEKATLEESNEIAVRPQQNSRDYSDERDVKPGDVFTLGYPTTEPVES